MKSANITKKEKNFIFLKKYSNYAEKWNNLRKGESFMVKTVVCFGDSNTHGYNAQNGGRFGIEERWTRILGKELGEEYDVMEEGVSGRTTVFDDPLFEGLSGLDAIHTCLMSHEPVDILVIMLGTNDTKERFSATSRNIAQGLARLTEKAKHVTGAWRGEPQIILVSPVPIEEGYLTSDVGGEMGAGCAEKSCDLGVQFERIAREQGCRFLDAAKIPGIGVIPTDYMHLTKESHKLLAAELAGIIREL